MTRQSINIGTGPDSYTGDNLRTAFTKVNDNFAQLYVGNVGANTSINVLTANTVSTNGNVNAGNVLVQYQVIASGNISAPIFIGNGRYLTGITASANSGNSAVAIGIGAGQDTQLAGAIAIGGEAGGNSQGVNSVAIGYRAGRTNQANSTIILNATGANLNATTANTFTVKPVRAVTSVTFVAPTSGSVPAGFSPMYYNPTTGEIIVITT